LRHGWAVDSGSFIFVNDSSFNVPAMVNLSLCIRVDQQDPPSLSTSFIHHWGLKFHRHTQTGWVPPSSAIFIVRLLCRHGTNKLCRPSLRQLEPPHIYFRRPQRSKRAHPGSARHLRPRVRFVSASILRGRVTTSSAAREGFGERKEREMEKRACSGRAQKEDRRVIAVSSVSPNKRARRRL
jgi:hypothetical protein